MITFLEQLLSLLFDFKRLRVQRSLQLFRQKFSTRFHFCCGIIGRNFSRLLEFRMDALVSGLEIRVLDAEQVRLEVDLEPVRVRARAVRLRALLSRVRPQQLLLLDLVEHPGKGASGSALLVSQLGLGQVHLGCQVGHLIQEFLAAAVLA